jgi:hypothetical protein
MHLRSIYRDHYENSVKSDTQGRANRSTDSQVRTDKHELNQGGDRGAAGLIWRQGEEGPVVVSHPLRVVGFSRTLLTITLAGA